MAGVFRNNRKKILWLLLFFGTVAAFCCALFLNYVPGGLMWNSKTLQFEDGATLELKAKELSITSASGEILWKSDKGYKVQDAFVCDLDGDGDQELTALLWKRGRFGKHRPYWIDSDEIVYSQHIFIYDISRDYELTQKWCASDIGPVVVRMKQMERNPAYLLTEDVDDKAVLWSWQSFGLKSMDNSVEFAAFGDNLIHEEIYLYGEGPMKGNYDFLYEPFKKDIEEADIAAIQLETILVDKSSAVAGYPSFGTPLGVGRAIVDAGFDLVCGAGNHSLDRGTYGIDVTTDFFAGQGVKVVGIQNSADNEYRPYEIITRNAVRIAVFDYTYGTNQQVSGDSNCFALHFLPQDEQQEDAFVQEIRSARSEADFVVVFTHWGNEYETQPSEYQLHMSQLLAEAGADVVIGTHPHVVQPMETMERPDGGMMLVYYSLGNFRANQAQMEETKRGAEALFTIEHCYDGVRVGRFEMKDIDAYWK
jgi:poly-gamma-glutamate capsule biosynthesis protein CapA/YwtB (metallophosphatase superfamily)